MTPQRQEFKKRYASALFNHVESGSKKTLISATALGFEAVSLGIETEGLAKLHQVSLASFQSKHRSSLQMKRSSRFVQEANAPVKEIHCAAQESRVQMVRMKEALGRRTEELADSGRKLKRGIKRRKVLQEALDKRGEQHKKCLQESLQLQKRLRLLTHRLLAAQESERKIISRELHDEVAQTLLGINVRLLSLKMEARSNSKGLKQHIINTQKLVTSSVRSVRQVVKGLGGK